MFSDFKRLKKFFLEVRNQKHACINREERRKYNNYKYRRKSERACVGECEMHGNFNDLLQCCFSRNKKENFIPHYFQEKYILQPLILPIDVEMEIKTPTHKIERGMNFFFTREKKKRQSFFKNIKLIIASRGSNLFF